MVGFHTVTYACLLAKSPCPLHLPKTERDWHWYVGAGAGAGAGTSTCNQCHVPPQQTSANAFYCLHAKCLPLIPLFSDFGMMEKKILLRFSIIGTFSIKKDNQNAIASHKNKLSWKKIVVFMENAEKSRWCQQLPYPWYFLCIFLFLEGINVSNTPCSFPP